MFWRHWRKKTITLHGRTKVINAKYHIDLLKLYEGNKSHYVYIKDYDRLIGSQTNKGTNKIYHCRYCQHGYKRQSSLEKNIITMDA